MDVTLTERDVEQLIHALQPIVEGRFCIDKVGHYGNGTLKQCCLLRQCNCKIGQFKLYIMYLLIYNFYIAMLF